MIRQPPDVQNERLERRTKGSRVFDGPNGNHILQCAVGALHWNNAGIWEPIDTTIELMAGRYRVRSAGYTWSYQPATGTAIMVKKADASEAQLRLVSVDGVSVKWPATTPFIMSPSKLRVTGIAPDFELVFVARPGDVEAYKIFRSANAPTVLLWEVRESIPNTLISNIERTTGLDNAERTNASRETNEVLRLNKCRPVELLHMRSTDDLSTPNWRQYTVTETLTGRTQWRNPVSRVAEWRTNELVYPVILDVTEVEDITANADDGQGLADDTWGSTNTTVYNYSPYYGGFRFQNVNVPQGATINSATLQVNVTNADPGAGHTATLKGQASDNAPAWAEASSNTPRLMSGTSASITDTASTSTGSRNITVTTIIQEIVNRAGWVANNSMRLGFTAFGASYLQRFEALENAGTDPATLTIDYTAAGGPSPAVNDTATVTEAVTMTMHLKNTAANDTATVTEAVTMHMPIHLRMEKLS